MTIVRINNLITPINTERRCFDIKMIRCGVAISKINNTDGLSVIERVVFGNIKFLY